jgi:hypothetical protein
MARQLILPSELTGEAKAEYERAVKLLRARTKRRKKKATRVNA